MPRTLVLRQWPDIARIVLWDDENHAHSGDGMTFTRHPEEFVAGVDEDYVWTDNHGNRWFEGVKKWQKKPSG